jgi:tetratricopeptide (TPR) repeat protein
MIMQRRASRPRTSQPRGICWHVAHVLLVLFLPGIVSTLGAQEKTAGESAGPLKRLSVAVLWLEDRTTDPNLAHWRYAGSLLNGSLGKVKAIRILSKGAVDYAYRQAGLQAGDPIDPNTARRMGEKIEAQRVVWGSYVLKNNQWHVEVRVIHVATGDVSPALAAAANDWFRVRDELCEQLLRALRVTPTAEETSKMTKRWTSSLEALEWCCRTFLSQEQGSPVPEVEQLCRKALAADPNCAAAYRALAATLGTQGKLDLAEEALQRAIQLDPNNASAHATLGWLFHTQKQPDRAEAEFRRACQLDKDDADSLMWLAVACAEDGRRDEAAGLLEMAVSLDRTNALIHAHLANMYAARGQQEEARRELAEARHYLPDGIPAGNALVMIGDTYRSLGKWPEAIESYERTMTLAKGLGVNPKTIRQVEQRIQGVKSILTPTFLQAPMPRQYTEEALEEILRDELTESERWLAANPFSCTDAMRQWAKELTHGANTDLDKARALFGELSARPDTRGRLKSRTAREVFETWKNPDIRLVCLDRAVLFVALARAVDVNAFFVHVTRLPDGTVMNHACAAVFLEDRVLLVDPSQRWLGAPHQQYAILDDLKAAAFLCFNNREADPARLAAYRAGLKLWPDSLQGRVSLVDALHKAGQASEARQVFAEIPQPQSADWEAALYWTLAGETEAAERHWKPAEEHLLESISIWPGQSAAHFHLGRAYVFQHRLAEARTAFRTCLRNEPPEFVAGVARRAIALINEEIGVEAAPGTAKSKRKP